MKSLKELTHLDFVMLEDGCYKLLTAIVYTSHRYNETCTVPKDYVSNGASGPATDIVSKAWWVHDRLWETLKWDSGRSCTRFQANWVLFDILEKENRWFRKWTWLTCTHLNALRLKLLGR